MDSKPTIDKKIELKEHGRVIARAMHEENMRIEKNMASAVKRKSTMLENAAQKALSGGSAT